MSGHVAWLNKPSEAWKQRTVRLIANTLTTRLVSALRALPPRSRLAPDGCASSHLRSTRRSVSTTASRRTSRRSILRRTSRPGCRPGLRPPRRAVASQRHRDVRRPVPPTGRPPPLEARRSTGRRRRTASRPSRAAWRRVRSSRWTATSCAAASAWSNSSATPTASAPARSLLRLKPEP